MSTESREAMMELLRSISDRERDLTKSISELNARMLVPRPATPPTELAIRETALDQAITCIRHRDGNPQPETVVKHAEAFYAFLINKQGTAAP